jgi:hypothetical protein
VLGPTYYKSVEDQQRIKERKEAREKEEMIYKQIENERAVQRRDQLLV